MTATRTRLTLDEFLALPEKKPALEFEEGMVTQKVSPKGRHSVLQFAMASHIDAIIRPRRLGRAFTELRSTFADLSRVPDVSVYRWNRIPRDAEGRVVDDFWEPPDIAIEIASPGQSVNALLRRCRTFVAKGVHAAVLINPADESVWVVRADQEPVRLGRGETLDLSDIIPDLRLEISALFDALKD